MTRSSLPPKASQLLSVITRAGAVAKRQRRAERSFRAQRSDWYRTVWVEAAERVGAEIDFIDGDLITIRRGNEITRVDKNYTDMDGPVTLRAVGDKALVHRTLRARDLPVPPHAEFDLASLETANTFLAEHQPCVVKPAAGTGAGAGVTTNVTTNSQIRRAALLASGHSSSLLIEAHIPGDNVRVIVLDGEVLDAVHRHAPHVVGDGQATIAALINQKNDRRQADGTARAQSTLRKDLDAETTLDRAGLSLSSVPENGERVQVKSVINDNEVEDNVGVLGKIDESTKHICVEAAAALGTRLAGVDLITTDISAPLVEIGGVILEVNTAPGLFHHQHTDVHALAARILDRCLTRSAD